MKTFRRIGLAVIAILLCFGATACSSDDDEPQTNSPIVGTWDYQSDYDGEGTFTFKSNGTLTWFDGEETSSNHTYALSGDKLKIIFNDNDDYTLGTIVIEGDVATYTYRWYDCSSNEQQSQTDRLMTLWKR